MAEARDTSLELIASTLLHDVGHFTNDRWPAIHFPHSLGLLYSALTYYTGFWVNLGEYKVLGFTPYGEPKYKQLMPDHLIDIKDDGSFWLNQKYFDYCTGLTMTSANFD